MDTPIESVRRTHSITQHTHDQRNPNTHTHTQTHRLAHTSADFFPPLAAPHGQRRVARARRAPPWREQRGRRVGAASDHCRQATRPRRVPRGAAGAPLRAAHAYAPTLSGVSRRFVFSNVRAPRVSVLGNMLTKIDQMTCWSWRAAPTPSCVRRARSATARTLIFTMRSFTFKCELTRIRAVLSLACVACAVQQRWGHAWGDTDRA